VPDATGYDVTDGALRVVAHVAGLGRTLLALRTPWLWGGALALVVIALLPGRAASPTGHGTRSQDPGTTREADGPGTPGVREHPTSPGGGTSQRDDGP
jgi:hypothetical protein